MGTKREQGFNGKGEKNLSKRSVIQSSDKDSGPKHEEVINLTLWI